MPASLDTQFVDILRFVRYRSPVPRSAVGAQFNKPLS